jgi:hypothetical protein
MAPLCLFISVFTSNKYTLEALSILGYDYLEKPFMPKNLDPVVLEILRVHNEHKPSLPRHSANGQSIL